MQLRRRAFVSTCTFNIWTPSFAGRKRLLVALLVNSNDVIVLDSLRTTQLIVLSWVFEHCFWKRKPVQHFHTCSLALTDRVSNIAPLYLEASSSGIK